ncbi:hypothetical protein HRG_000155 [Hirsutella rhossiliensis]|uniref:Uncharacterized protein n=1 Tax=Hirsutella rhossiliensis TaxID=111463 RepID=A0A9P8N4K2_9HYPO|nr:uncharacterized protein HRG_00155 [Hirsutella rhossiliensis]KAH0967513.1 hypothetical protein HRG_00155 [Hirsutella rhossiliensis]
MAAAGEDRLHAGMLGYNPYATAEMEALAKVVQDGKSLAAATRAVDLASMTAREKDQYHVPKRGVVTLPPFDCVANRNPLPTGSGTLTYSERAHAMDSVWKNKGATAENASWLEQNMNYMLRLVDAEVKARHGGTSFTAVAETVNIIVVTGAANMNGVLSRRINLAQQLCKAREDLIRSKLQGEPLSLPICETDADGTPPPYRHLSIRSPSPTLHEPKLIATLPHVSDLMAPLAVVAQEQQVSH